MFRLSLNAFAVKQSRPPFPSPSRGKKRTKLNGILADVTDRRSDDEPLAASTLPWQVVALLLCFAMLPIVAAMLHPDVFGAPLEQF